MAYLKHRREHGENFSSVIVTIPCKGQNVEVYLIYHTGRKDRKRINSKETRDYLESRSHELKAN